MAASKIEDRLEFRTTREVKALIERAAALSGASVTEFALRHLVHAAREVVQEDTATLLSNRDRDRFLAMLEADSEPNEALREAFRVVR